MEQKPNQIPSEAELKRLLALDRAAVEEHLTKNKAAGRKLGSIIAVVLLMVALISAFAIIAINSHH